MSSRSKQKQKPKDIPQDFPSNGTLITLSIVALVLLCLLVYTVIRFTYKKMEAYGPAEQPQLVLDFLEAITAEDCDVEGTLRKYLVTTKAGDFGISSTKIGAIRDKLSFDYVLRPKGETLYGYQLVFSEPNYVEFSILDEKGNCTYPLVGFGYELTEDGSKIADYSMGRLQPFSRLHPEYRKEWDR